MTEEEFFKKKEEFERELELKSIIANATANTNRARSVTVGTAFGGTTELTMRSDTGSTWCVLQPVEVIELIHQLAANVGCHLQLKPREDFSSWRDWKVTEEEKLHYNGHAPFVNDMAPHMRIGADSISVEQLEQRLKEVQESHNGKNNVQLDKDGNVINKKINKNNRVHTLGGPGGIPLGDLQNEISVQLTDQIKKLKKAKKDGIMATKDNIDKSTPKRATKAS